MLTLEYNKETIVNTLELLSRGGDGIRECVVLWLGKRGKNKVCVTEVYLPSQRSGVDVFHIPPASMQELMKYLKLHRLMVAAQVHTHPMEAFHSRADDKWAFVRHESAVSIVLPYFAKNISAETYWSNAETYCLSRNNTWDHISGISLKRICKERK